MSRGQAALVIVMAAVAIGTIPVAGPAYGVGLLVVVIAAAVAVARWQDRRRS